MISPSELSCMDGLGNITRFPCGRVTITIPGVSVHLTSEGFMMFASMVAQAKTSYMDNALKEMVREREGE